MYIELSGTDISMTQFSSWISHDIVYFIRNKLNIILLSVGHLYWYTICAYSVRIVPSFVVNFVRYFYMPVAVNAISNWRKDLNNQTIYPYICPLPIYILVFTSRKCRCKNKLAFLLELWCHSNPKIKLYRACYCFLNSSYPV